MPDGVGLYHLSLLFGGGVIVFFAINQFNEPSFEASKELERLIRFLKISDFRNRRVVWRAYAAYAALLLLMYLVICSFFTQPMLAAIGWVAPEGVEVDSAQSPVVPLMISLGMVGLAPGIKPLQQFEARIRFAAHYLSGIPARLVQGCQQLQKLSLGLPHDGSGMLLPEADWRRLAHYRRYGQLLLDDPEDFAEDMAKILAYRAWILKHALGLTRIGTRPRIERNDDDIRGRIDRLVLNLDILSDFRQPGPPGNALEQTREDWKKLAVDADELCADVCLMLMLRLEHGLINIRTLAAEQARDEGETETESAEAEARLRAFMEGAGQLVDRSTLVGRLWFRSTIIVLVLATVWGIVLGSRETGIAPEQVAALNLGITYGITALIVYSVAIFVALALHDRAMRTDDTRRQWPNMATSHWTHWMGPAVKVFALSSIAVVLGIVAYSTLVTGSARGFSSESYWQAMLGALYYEGPRSLLGPVLALGIIASVDVSNADDHSMTRARWFVMAVTVIVLAVLAPLLQALALQYRDVNGYEMCPGYVTTVRPDLSFNEIKDYCEQYRFTSWGALIRKYPEELSLVTLRTMLIGAAVLFVCQETLAAGPAGSGGRGVGAGARSLFRSRAGIKRAV